MDAAVVPCRSSARKAFARDAFSLYAARHSATLSRESTCQWSFDVGSDANDFYFI